MIDTATLGAAIAAHLVRHSPVHRCTPRCSADIGVPLVHPDPLRDEPTGIGTDDDRFMARMVIRQGRLARERCVQGHTMEHRYSAHLGEWDACTRCGLIVVEEAAPTPDPLREAAQAVVDAADPDDDFDGEFIEYLVPYEVIDALRAALKEGTR